jgi:hypothetical protein
VAKIPPADLEAYGTWLKVGMALHHQTDGKKEGFEIIIVDTSGRNKQE